MNTSLIGSIPLQNGETAWVVYREIEMPDLTQATKGIGRFYRGASAKDLERPNLRALILGKEADGSRVMYDCAVESKAANNAIQATCEDARA